MASIVAKLDAIATAPHALAQNGLRYTHGYSLLSLSCADHAHPACSGTIATREHDHGIYAGIEDEQTLPKAATSDKYYHRLDLTKSYSCSGLRCACSSCRGILSSMAKVDLVLSASTFEHRGTRSVRPCDGREREISIFLRGYRYSIRDQDTT